MNFTQMEDYNKDPNILEKFGRNIVEAVKAGKVEPVIGREDEIRRVIKILSRKTKIIQFLSVNLVLVKRRLLKV